MFLNLPAQIESFLACLLSSFFTIFALVSILIMMMLHYCIAFILGLSHLSHSCSCQYHCLLLVWATLLLVKTMGKNMTMDEADSTCQRKLPHPVQMKLTTWVITLHMALIVLHCLVMDKHGVSFRSMSNHHSNPKTVNEGNRAWCTQVQT